MTTDLSVEGALSGSGVGAHPRVGSDGFIHWEGMPVGTLRIEDGRLCCTQFLAIIGGTQFTNMSLMTKPHMKPEG